VRGPGGTPLRSLAGILGCLLLGSTAHAQWGATVAVESDLRYRGVSLSDGNPGARLTLNYDGAQRWYAGGSINRTTLAFLDTYVQATGYAGVLTAPVDGRRFEAGVVATHFAGLSDYDYGEVYAGVLAERWSARVFASPDYYGRNLRTAYAEVDAATPLGIQARAFAHLGALVPIGGGEGEARRTRFDLSIGAAWVVGGWDLHLAAVTASPYGPYPAPGASRRSTLVLGASFSL